MAAWYVLPTLPHNFFYLKFKCSNISFKLKQVKHSIEYFLFLIIKLFFFRNLHKIRRKKSLIFHIYTYNAVIKKEKYLECQSSCFGNPCRPLQTSTHSVMDPTINTINIHTQSNSKSPNIIIQANETFNFPTKPNPVDRRASHKSSN